MKIEKYILNHQRDLQGKKYLVTGANSGIGYEATRILTEYGAQVTMACRSKERAQKAREEIISLNPQANLEVVEYDQASRQKIDALVLKLKQNKAFFDGIVFNAGIYHPSANLKTAEGYPLTMGVNFIGLFYFISKLNESGILKSEKSVRLVFVGSLIWWNTKVPTQLDKESLNRLSLQKQYNISKTMIGRLAYQLMKNRKLNDGSALPNNCQVFLMHPGVSATGIVNSKSKGFSESFSRAAHRFLYIFVHHPRKACLGIIESLISEENDSNYIFVPRGPFHISGFPKKIKYPHNLKKDDQHLLNWAQTIIR
ncbi:MAG: SDR family NAD(P)-dependent oxidoreductase [Bacilli bacterium]|jgi:NAD(P)-dependent dehydrogenase (short-subunit alcohol dehydrogenase family)|nr:SDR family NAD(P)-dependent oxidoreductase [Bacilli bacterium]MCH4236223.1 SDR family NAD(P)-dependent oxidoreductase [Bacilli bacterium]